MSHQTQPPAARGRRRPWTVGLPGALVVLGIITIGPNHALGAAFIAGALLVAGAAASVVALNRHQR